MSIKNSYYKAQNLGLGAIVEVPKYLFGYDIHQAGKKRRQEIRETKEDLQTRGLKLSKNYAWEGLRQVVRYTPLVFEGLILTDNLPINTWLYTSLPVRATEQVIISLHILYQLPKTIEEGFEGVAKELEELNKIIEEGFEKLNKSLEDFIQFINSGRYDPNFTRVLQRGRLLRNPYSVLGIDRTANEEEIKKAYWDIAKKCHPDPRGGDKTKVDKFIEATKAYYQLTSQYHKL